MGAYAGAAEWRNDIYQFETTDQVMGGPEGIDNRPLKELADRTQWLRQNMGISDMLAGYSEVTENGAVGPSDAGKLIVGKPDTVLTLTLAPVADFKPGAVIPFYAFGGFNKVTSIVAQQPIVGANGNYSTLHLHLNETAYLLACEGHWRLVHHTGNLFSAGEEVKARKVLENTLELNGQLLQRSRFPRLWQFVQSLQSGGEVVSELEWQNDPFQFRSCFSTGDGTTNFRVPDERGLFERAMDNGRLVDLDRTHPYAGGYQGDALASHAHTMRIHGQKRGTGNDPNDQAANKDQNNGPFGTTGTWTTQLTGGTETRPKNVAKLFLIKY